MGFRALLIGQWAILQGLVGFTAAFTESTSRWRYPVFFLIVMLACRLHHLLTTESPTTRLAGLLAGLCWTHVFNALDILLLSRVTYTEQLDWQRRKEKTKSEAVAARPSSRRKQIAWSLKLPFNLRRIDTPWQISRLPAFDKADPKFVPSRLNFLGMSISNALLAWLTIKYLHRHSSNEEVSEIIATNQGVLTARSTAEFVRLAMMQASLVAASLVQTRAGQELVHCLYGIAAVAIGVSKPASRPPLGESFMEAWSLRRFWGLVWHQEFRKFLTSSANFITADILQLRSNSLLARNSRLFFSFIVSGFIHFLMDLARGIPLNESGSMTHFVVLALGIMVEDLLTYMAGTLFDSQPKWRKRALGYAWVSLFFFFAVPVYWYPICRRMQQTGERVPRF